MQDTEAQAPAGRSRVRGRRGAEEPSARAGVRALERGLALLEALAQQPQATLTELAQRARLPASTVFRLLETLTARGFVTQERSGQYRLGVRAFEIGSTYLPRLQLNDVALPVMRELMQELGETVNLAVRDRADAVYIAQVEGAQMLRMFTRVGARTPAYCSGVGKALLAWLPLTQVRALLGPGPWLAYTEHTLTTFEALERALIEVRHRGYAVDDQEREAGVRCMAVPIVDADGAAVAALSLSAPTVRLTPARLAEVAPAVVGAGQRISERLCLAGR